MFHYATAFNQNLENWDVTRVEQCDGFSTKRSLGLYPNLTSLTVLNKPPQKINIRLFTYTLTHPQRLLERLI